MCSLFVFCTTVFITLSAYFLELQTHSEISTARIFQNQTTDLEHLKTELNTASNEVNLLKLDISKLEMKITGIGTNCDQEIQHLRQKYAEMLQKAEENQKAMAHILKKIQDEEQLHVTLEHELEKVSQVLELYEAQYLVVSTDLQLMELRRQNGTSKWCTDLSHALASDNDVTLMFRAHMSSPHTPRNTKSQQELEIIAVRRKLRINLTLKSSLSEKLNTLNKAYTAQIEMCNGKKRNINQLIDKSFLAAKASEESIQKFSKDLEAAVETSKAIQLEITTGKNLFKEIKELVLKMKTKMEGYKSDYICFNKTMELE